MDYMAVYKRFTGKLYKNTLCVSSPQFADCIKMCGIADMKPVTSMNDDELACIPDSDYYEKMRIAMLEKGLHNIIELIKVGHANYDDVKISFLYTAKTYVEHKLGMI